MPAEIVWAILQVPTMGRMGNMRMMIKTILSWASLATMRNPAGWCAQSQKQYSITWSVFGRCRSSLVNWRNQAGEMRSTTPVREIRSTGQAHERFQPSSNLKRKMMQPVLRWQHLGSLCKLFIASPENRNCDKWLLHQGAVIWRNNSGSPRQTKACCLSHWPQRPIC